MAKKSSVKKHNSLQARVIAKTTSPDSPSSVATSTLKKDRNNNFVEVKGSVDSLTWSTHVSWKSTLLGPVIDRSTEQLFLDTRNTLCSVLAFREEIAQIRNQLLPNRERLIGPVASKLCDIWKVPDGTEWFVWLINHWDPNKAKYPPLSSPPPPDGFCPWTIELNRLRETEKSPAVCRSAIITLNAGISLREAQRIVELAQRELASYKRKGRPGYSDLEIEAVRSEFVKLGIPRSQKRNAMILNVQKALRQSCNRQFSRTFIQKHLQRWLVEQNQSVRQYFKEPPSPTS